MDELPICPHCQSSNSVFVNVRAYGWCEEYYDQYGTAVEMGTDKLCFSTSQTVRCDNCLKIRRDLMLGDAKRAGRKIVPKLDKTTSPSIL